MTRMMNAQHARGGSWTRLVATTTLVTGLIMGAAPEAATAQEASRDANMVGRGALSTLLGGLSWLVLTPPGADWVHKNMGLRSGDDGNLRGAVAVGPLAATPGAALGAWLLAPDRESPGYHYAAAVAGAYLPSVVLAHFERLGGGYGYTSFVAWLAAPLSASITSLAAPGSEWQFALTASRLSAGEYREGCHSDRTCLSDFRNPGRIELETPAFPWSLAVSARRPAGDRWHLGAEVTGLVVQDRVLDQVRDAISDQGNRIATTLLLTAEPTLTRSGGFTLEALGAVGTTTYHDRAGFAVAAGLSGARELGPGTELVLRIRASRIPGAGVLELGLGMRFSSDPD